MRRAFKYVWTCAAIVALVAVYSGTVSAETDQGAASFTPWSGYWWQNRSGGLSRPLSAYDRLWSTNAAQWERDNNAKPDAPTWFGHCHAWSAASVSDPEPTRRRTVRQVAFGVSDLKGLLCACHDQDVSNSFGDRYGDGRGSEDRLDLKPDELWRLLQTYLKQQHLPLILDFESGEQVWNYPAFRYRVKYEVRSDGSCRGQMEIVAAEDNVAPDFVGTETALHTYTFRCRWQDGAIVMGTGEWTGDSVEDHPDFAWYPYVTVPENPEVDLDKAAEILGHEIGAGARPNGDQPSQPDAPVSTTVPPVSSTPNDPSQPATPDAPPTAITQVDDLLSADELVALVANRASHFSLDAYVDRGDGGRYEAGDPITVSAVAGADGYLYAFDIGPKGDLTLVYPEPGQVIQVKKGEKYDFSSTNGKSRFIAEGSGQHDLKVLVTTKPLRMTGFRQVSSQQVTQQNDPVQLQRATGQQQQASSPQHSQGATVRQRTSSANRLVVCPTAKRRVVRRLFSVFRKGLDDPGVKQEKVSEFAQDIVSYVVIGSNSQSESEDDAESS